MPVGGGGAKIEKSFFFGIQTFRLKTIREHFPIYLYPQRS